MSERQEIGSGLALEKYGGQLPGLSLIAAPPVAQPAKKVQRGPKVYLDHKRGPEFVVPPRSQGDAGQLPAKIARPRVCILDFDSESRDALTELLSVMGYEVLALPQIIGASSQIQFFAPDILVLDIAMPALSGPKLVEVLRRNLSPMPPLILFCDLEEDELARLAQEVGANDFVPKSGGYLGIINRIQVQSLLRKRLEDIAESRVII